MCMNAAGAVLAIDTDRQEATVDTGRRTQTVSLAVMTLEGKALARGDWVLIHTGFAVERLDKDSVADLLALRDEMREGDRHG